LLSGPSLPIPASDLRAPAVSSSHPRHPLSHEIPPGVTPINRRATIMGRPNCAASSFVAGLAAGSGQILSVTQLIGVKREKFELNTGRDLCCPRLG
jgi:hypothetical protein